jgi:PqqD family protein of HPr-rel-A system
MDASGRFLVKHWHDGAVVFDRQFGDTHALDPATSAVFVSLQDGDASRSTLIENISSYYPESSIQELETRVDELLEHLKRLDLVKATIN